MSGLLLICVVSVSFCDVLFRDDDDDKLLSVAFCAVQCVKEKINCLLRLRRVMSAEDHQITLLNSGRRCFPTAVKVN